MDNYNHVNIGRAISVLYRQGNSFFSKKFSKFGIGSGQHLFLINLYKNDGISQEQLSELLLIDKGTTAKAVKKLEDLGFIKRVKDTEDKRVNKLYLTDNALEIKDEIFGILTEWNTILTTNLTEEEILQASNLLNKLSNNIK